MINQMSLQKLQNCLSQIRLKPTTSDATTHLNHSATDATAHPNHSATDATAHPNHSATVLECHVKDVHHPP